ncbi:MAG TPA: hypothetical protein VGM17_03565 [Rhizomicrobium sp.]
MSESHATTFFDAPLAPWARRRSALPQPSAAGAARRFVIQPERAAGVVALLLIGAALGTVLAGAWHAVRAHRNDVRMSERLRWRERHQDGADFVVLPRPLDDPGPAGSEFES